MPIPLLELQMPPLKMPLSGDVVQSINPVNSFLSGNRFGPIAVNLGPLSEPNVEPEALADVASYGRQPGRIEDALVVLLKHFRPDAPLSEEEETAISDFKKMVSDVANIKESTKIAGPVLSVRSI
jgi:hypothetical protein